jgi:hypothetical protein
MKISIEAALIAALGNPEDLGDVTLRQAERAQQTVEDRLKEDGEEQMAWGVFDTWSDMLAREDLSKRPSKKPSKKNGTVLDKEQALYIETLMLTIEDDERIRHKLMDGMAEKLDGRLSPGTDLTAWLDHEWEEIRHTVSPPVIPKYVVRDAYGSYLVQKEHSNGWAHFAATATVFTDLKLAEATAWMLSDKTNPKRVALL